MICKNAVVLCLLSHYLLAYAFQHLSHLKTSQMLTRTTRSALFSNPRKIDVGDGGFQSYAADLLKHSLLNAVDECSLAKQYQLSVQIQVQSQHMSKSLGRQATNEELSTKLGISPEQLPHLIERGETAKRTLVRANMRLVFHIAKHYRFRGIAYPDLVQEGTFGLIKAVDKFDPERGFRFSTYASWWIKQSVSRAVAEKCRIVRLPVHIHDLMVSIARLEKNFFVLNNRKPTTLELAERLCLPLQKVELLVKCARDVNSMDESLYQNKGKMASNNDVQVKDRIASGETEPSYINEKNSLREELRRSMRNLSEREAQIVEMRFGLKDGNQMTLEEIGKLFSVTRERIRQIESRALSKMRTPVKVDDMKEVYQEESVIIPSSAVQSVYSPILVEKLRVFAE